MCCLQDIHLKHKGLNKKMVKKTPCQQHLKKKLSSIFIISNKAKLRTKKIIRDKENIKNNKNSLSIYE